MVWLMLIMVIFVGPLFVFRATLAKLKFDALLDYSVLASNYKQQRDASETPEGKSMEELVFCYTTAKSIYMIPASKETFITLVIATGLPWLAVVLTQIPFFELLGTVLQALM